jgi:hypothetical protein
VKWARRYDIDVKCSIEEARMKLLLW